MNDKAKCKNCTNEIIEEMARVICPNSKEWTCKACNWGSKPNCAEDKNAEKLYNAGDRKSPEDWVVWTKEEYEGLQNKLERYSEEREFVGKCLTDATLRCVELTNDFNDMLDSIYDLARKKTAKEILSMIDKIPTNEVNELNHLRLLKINIAKQFGVEVEE